LKIYLSFFPNTSFFVLSQNDVGTNEATFLASLVLVCLAIVARAQTPKKKKEA
jgi:hypothetical protein